MGFAGFLYNFKGTLQNNAVKNKPNSTMGGLACRHTKNMEGIPTAKNIYAASGTDIRMENKKNPF